MASGCIAPPHLQKYANTNEPVANETTPLANDPTISMTPVLEAGAPRHMMPPSANAAVPPRATIYAVDTQTFRLSLREEDVWDSLLNVLMRNYNLNVVDRASGVVTTEWDSYYIHQIVYRNKVSARVRRLTRNQVELIVHNSVEKLQDGSSSGTVGSIWVPAGEGQKEVGRIVQNVAITLNQPPPTLLPGMLATDTDAAPAKDIR